MGIPRKANSPEQKARRRQAILDAALACFAETDYERVGMTAVARRAGVAKGTVYLYFETKEALFLGVHAQELEAWFDEVDSRLAELPRDRCDEVVAIFWRGFAARPALTRLLAIVHVVLERNVELEAARAFKTMLLRRVLGTGELLEARLTHLAPGEGARLLLHVNALVIGLVHMARPAPVVRRVLAEPGLELFRVDFDAEFTAALERLLRGGAEREETS